MTGPRTVLGWLQIFSVYEQNIISTEVSLLGGERANAFVR